MAVNGGKYYANCRLLSPILSLLSIIKIPFIIQIHGVLIDYLYTRRTRSYSGSICKVDLDCLPIYMFRGLWSEFLKNTGLSVRLSSRDHHSSTINLWNDNLPCHPVYFFHFHSIRSAAVMPNNILKVWGHKRIIQCHATFFAQISRHPRHGHKIPRCFLAQFPYLFVKQKTRVYVHNENSDMYHISDGSIDYLF